MEPIVDPIAAARRKRRKALFFLSSILGLLVFGSLGYLFWYINTPQQQFYSALEKQMQSRYISQEYLSYRADKADQATMKILADFSDMSNPKKSAVYTLKSDNAQFPRDRQIEEINLEPDKFFDRIVKADTNLKQKLDTHKFSIDQWYQVEDNGKTEGLKRVGRFPVLPGSVPVLTIIGNFSETERKQVIDAIKSKNIYRVHDVHAKTLNGQRMSVYTVTVNIPELLSIATTMPGYQATRNPATLLDISDSNTKFFFWINDEGLIRKITFSANADSSSIYKNRELLLEYPQAVSIREPTGVKDGRR